MSKTTIGIIIGIVVLIAAGVAVKVVTTPKGSDEMSEYANVSANMPASTTPTESGNSMMSLQDLLGGGRTVSCTFSDQYDTVSSSGTVYIANGQMRGDFDTTTSGKTIMSHMILKDKTSYLWTGDNNTGMKMMTDTTAQAQTNQPQPPSQNQAVDPNKKLNYACSPWVADTTKFELPTGVTFTDFSAMAHGMMNEGTNAPKMPGHMMPINAPGASAGLSAECQACVALPVGTARDQCLASLHCAAY